MTHKDRSKWWRTERSWAGLAIVMVTGVLVVKLGFIVGVSIGLVATGAMVAARAAHMRR
jgi:MFS superfamily sulfate permease-like transporter